MSWTRWSNATTRDGRRCSGLQSMALQAATNAKAQIQEKLETAAKQAVAARATFEAQHKAELGTLQTQLREYKLKLFDMREALEQKAGGAVRGQFGVVVSKKAKCDTSHTAAAFCGGVPQDAEEMAELRSRLRLAQQERDSALAAKAELEQISAELLEMVDKK